MGCLARCSSSLGMGRLSSMSDDLRGMRGIEGTDRLHAPWICPNVKPTRRGTIFISVRLPPPGPHAQKAGSESWLRKLAQKAGPESWPRKLAQKSRVYCEAFGGLAEHAEAPRKGRHADPPASSPGELQTRSFVDSRPLPRAH